MQPYDGPAKLSLQKVLHRLDWAGLVKDKRLRCDGGVFATYPRYAYFLFQQYHVSNSFN